MGVFRGRVLSELLRVWCKRLNTVTESTRAACPAWDVCFNKWMFKEQVASSLLAGKAKQVQKAHNELHVVLSKLSTAGSVVDLAPRLQEHLETREAVTLALHILSGAKDCATIIEGVEVLKTYKQHHLGPQRAATFLAHHPADKRSAAIPDIFWHELEVLKADCSTSAKHGGGLASNIAPAQAMAAVVKTEESTQTTAKVEPEDGTKTKAGVKREVGKDAADSRLRRRRRE